MSTTVWVRRKVWRYIDLTLWFVRRVALWAAAGVFIFGPLRPGWGVYIR